jgi:hypothetical protein
LAIPEKDQARDTFGPYHGLIWRIIHEAWGEWRLVQRLRSDNGLPPLLYQRSIANYMFDAIARRAIPAFGAEDRVLLDIDAQTFKIFVGGIAARFKKGGDDKLGNSIPTLTALAFMEADGVLPGMPLGTAKVEIIWLPNDIWTQVERVLVIARDGDELVWEYEIDDPGSAGSGEVIPFPPAPAAPPEPEDGSGLVKPKAKPDALPKKL